MRTLVSRTQTGLLCVIAAGLLAACAAPPQPRDMRPEQVAQAERADISGNHAEAAGLWEDAARISPDPDRQTYLLRAAEAWFRADRSTDTRRVLEGIEDQLLTPTDISRYAILRAELALASADVEQVGFFLDVAAENLQPDQEQRYLELLDLIARIEANPASFTLASAANMLSEMDPYTTAEGLALLQLLEDVPSSVLEHGAASGEPAVENSAWLDLALRIRRGLVSRSDLGAAGTQWAVDYPGHPVDEAGFIDLWLEYGRGFAPPAQVAVLLPTAGNLAAAATAIRDGLLTSYFERPHRATLSFHATGEDPQSAVSAYFQAMREGADWIIGPLRREAVEALTGLGGLGVPALVLNRRSDSGGPAEQDLLFSLSLSQEDEARAIARKALATGNTRVLTLVADTAWGSRVEAAFLDEFSSRDGQVVATSQFNPTASDHGELLTRLLKIDQSRDRKNRLQATMGVNLAFEPIRRDDFDLIFLAATPEQGRQIRPQLRFHDAGDKAVFAMSRIYSGELDAISDQDLNGVYFPTSNWRKPLEDRVSAAELRSLRGGSLGHLYALGADAWDLVKWLPLMMKDPDLAFSGAIGSLRLASDGELVRDPIWAVFSGGRPKPVEWSPGEE